jgi:hypothetical protein
LSLFGAGDQMMTFTVHGWASGLLQADLIEEFLVHYFSLSAHAYTRGSWIAPESTVIDRNQSSVSFCTPATLTAPILLKWLLVWEHPISHTVWLGKAIPRVWLSEGEVVSVRVRRHEYRTLSLPHSDDVSRGSLFVIQGAGTAYGKVSMSLRSQLDSRDSITANITLAPLAGCSVISRACGLPLGGLVLRLRTPGKRRIAKVLVGGVAWAVFNSTAETVSFGPEGLGQGGLRKLQDITVTYSHSN